MRKHIRVCGVEFNVEEVQGGKLRATNEKMLGFAYEGSSLRELRDKLPEALGDWDQRSTDLGPYEDADTTDLKVKGYLTQPQSVGVHSKRLSDNAPIPMNYNSQAEYQKDLADWHMRQQRAKELARQHQQYVREYLWV